MNIEQKITSNNKTIYVFREESTNTIGNFLVKNGKIENINVSQTDVAVFRDICNPMFLSLVNSIDDNTADILHSMLKEIRKYHNNDN